MDCNTVRRRHMRASGASSLLANAGCTIGTTRDVGTADVPPSRLCRESRIVLTLYAADHLSCKRQSIGEAQPSRVHRGAGCLVPECGPQKRTRHVVRTFKMSKQMFPNWSTLGWKHGVVNTIVGALYG